MVRSKKSKTYETTHPATGELLEIHDRPEVYAMGRQNLKEIRAQESRARRIGRMAVRVAVAPLELANAVYSSLNEVSVTEMAKRESRKSLGHIATAIPGILLVGGIKASGKLGGEIVTGVAADYAAKQHARVKQERQAAHQKATEVYKTKHPDEVAKLQKQRQQKIINEASSRSASQQNRMINYLTANQYGIGRNAGSYVAQSIPRRSSGFEGSYDELAAATLTEALTAQRQDDGSIALLGDRVRSQHARAVREAHAINQLADIETGYNGGVGTALWKLGFVETAGGEAGISYGDAAFNPAITWSQETEYGSDHGLTGKTTTHRAQLPFDRSNELHAMLLPDELRGSPDLAIELEFSNGIEPDHGHVIGDEYMNIRVVPAMVQQELVAA